VCSSDLAPAPAPQDPGPRPEQIIEGLPAPPATSPSSPEDELALLKAKLQVVEETVEVTAR